MTTAAVSFLLSTGGSPHPSSNSGTMTYSAHVSDIIATEDGLSRIMETQEKRKAGAGPNASRRYAYSQPDLGIMVPSSARLRAPVCVCVGGGCRGGEGGRRWGRKGV